MRLNFILISFLLGISFFVQGQKKVSNEAFDTMLQSLLQHSVPEVLPKDCATSTNIIYLDAREKKEYKVSHLPNSQWIGYESFQIKNIKHIQKDHKLVVYCTVGFRSEKVTEKLIAAGYTDVANLYGGIFEWMHTSNNVVKDSVTKNVHTYNKEWSQWLGEGVGNKIY